LARVERVWLAPVEIPRDQQALAFRPYVAQAVKPAEPRFISAFFSFPRDDAAVDP